MQFNNLFTLHSSHIYFVCIEILLLFLLTLQGLGFFEAK